MIDLISGIRSACSKNFIIGLRLPGNDFVEGGIDEIESSLITELIALKTKVDFFTFFWVRSHSYGNAFADFKESSSIDSPR